MQFNKLTIDQRNGTTPKPLSAHGAFRAQLEKFEGRGAFGMSVMLNPLQVNMNKKGAYEFSLENAHCTIRNGIFILEDQSNFQIGADISEIVSKVAPRAYSDGNSLLASADFTHAGNGSYSFRGAYRVFETGLLAVFLKTDGIIEVQAAVPLDRSFVFSGAYANPLQDLGELQVVAMTPSSVLRVSAVDGAHVANVIHSEVPLLAPSIVRGEHPMLFEVTDRTIGSGTDVLRDQLNPAKRKLVIDFADTNPMLEPPRQ